MINKYHTWIEIDRKLIRKNIRNLLMFLDKNVGFVAIIKANAYGFGLVKIASIVTDYKPKYLGISYIEEAIKLRMSQINAPILMLTQPLKSDILRIIKYKITPTVYDLDFINILSKEAGKLGIKVPVHIKVDTGLHRLGLSSETAFDAIKRISLLEGVKIEGIYTHYANAYDVNLKFTDKQYIIFDNLINKLGKIGIKPRYIHVANSSAAAWYSKSNYNLVRFGMVLFGLQPNDFRNYPIVINQCMCWKTKVLQIKNIKKGDNVGYGNSWHAPTDMKIATIAVGYMDGFRRSPNNFKYVLCNGQKCQIVGNVTMGQSMIDISDLPKASVDDEVVLIGRQNKEQITFEEIASNAKTICEEIAVMISPDIPRIFV